jgi:uncharacterized iron-regulated protein
MQAHADKRVWLLGEQHDQPAHHAWQLEVLSVLHAREPSLAIAMEMFPREAQPALDDWVAGNMDWPTLLASSHWEEVWGFPADYYRPLLEFARLHRIRLIAMNVHPSVTSAVFEGGADALPEKLAVELGTPVVPPARYREDLAASFRMHRTIGLGDAAHPVAEQHARAAGEPAGPGVGGEAPAEDPGDAAALERFIAAQLTWDRAMAVAIHGALDHDRSPVHVVAILGEAHAGRDRGVRLQLQSMGIADSVSLLPAAPGMACPDKDANPLLADARFVMPAGPVPDTAGMPRQARPRLGVALGVDELGVRILSVAPDSLAEREGLLADDVITELAGRRCESPSQVIEAVRRQPAGTWLPIVLERDGERRAHVIRFPGET